MKKYLFLASLGTHSFYKFITKKHKSVLIASALISALAIISCKDEPEPVVEPDNPNQYRPKSWFDQEHADRWPIRWQLKGSDNRHWYLYKLHAMLIGKRLLY